MKTDAAERRRRRPKSPGAPPPTKWSRRRALGLTQARAERLMSQQLDNIQLKYFISHFHINIKLAIDVIILQIFNFYSE